MTIAATGYQGFDQFVMGTSGYRTIEKYATIERQLMGVTNGSSYGRNRVAKTIQALLGVAVGASKAVTMARVTAVQSEFGPGVSQGGKRVIESYAVQTGVTTSADQTRLQKVFTPKMMPTFPNNKDGFGFSVGNIGRGDSI